MASLDETPILELGRTPIAGAAPTGVDAADDPQYIAVMAEMGHMDRIEGAPPNWRDIEQHCVSILSAKSKDIEIAAALGHALFKRSSYAGLAAALGLCNELVNNFWDGLFPERPRRRKARMEGLLERFTDGGWFKENPPKPADFDGLDLCVTRVEELKNALTARMADDPPDFAKFSRAVKEQAAKRPKPSEPSATAAQASDDGSGGSFIGGAVADVDGALKSVRAAVTYLWKANPADPQPYAVIRAIKWAAIALPTTDEGKFQNEPPDAQLVDALGHQLANGLWQYLLENAEPAFYSNDPLWLDLQRYTCAALTGLGPSYVTARQAVVGLTAGLVQRLGGGLYELKFRNGKPLCSGETRMWIESDVCPPQQAGGSGIMSNGKLTEATTKARQLAGSGKLKDALKELQDGLASCQQRRDRFLWRLRIAQLCFDAQRLQLAAPLLEECHDEIRRYRIDEWEPSLAVDVAEALYRCRKSLTAADKTATVESLQGVRDSFAWLCQLNPLAALAAESGA